MSIASQTREGTAPPAFSLGEPRPQPRVRGVDPLRPAAWELCALGLLIFGMVVGEQVLGFSVHEPINWIAPVCVMITLAFGALRMARLEPRSVWSSLYSFRVSTAVYFGFGSLVPWMLDPMQRVMLNNFYEARPDEVFKLNLLVAVSCLVILFCASLASVLFPPRAAAITTEHDDQRLFFGILFAAVGYGVKMSVEVPLAFGAYGGVAVPGILLQLSQLSAVGLYLLATHAFRRKLALLPLVLALLAADIMVGALEFSKFAMLLPLLMFLLAWLSMRMTLGRAVLATALFLSAYSASQPFIEFGRHSLMLKYESIAAGEFGDRFEITKQYFSGARRERFDDDAPTGMMRLSYVNAGCFAISMFDSGNPGPSLDYALATFVPRLLWPEKPIITDIGGLFNLMATGNAKSASAPGYFADAYWAAGWKGVFAFSVVIGLLFAFYSRFAVNVLASGRWLLIPLALLSMKMGLRVDGVLVSDLIGASVIWFWSYVGARMIERPVDGLVQLFERRMRERANLASSRERLGS
jgi:hypothetical protein